MTTIESITLQDGLHLPVLGFGTYQIKGLSGAESIKNAIELGYRLIDSAYNYENEGTVGEAVRRTSVPREELIITSKLPGRYQNYKKAIETVEESLFRANLSYYDIYLIHWPNPLEDHFVEAWQALIEMKKRGFIRSIGVCNFIPEYIERLEKETGVTPSINQIELHPYFNQAKDLQWYKDHHVTVEAWSPLGRGNNILSETIIADIAKRHNKSASQVVLRWQLQHDVVPIPKASSPQHQAANLDIFDFSLSPSEISVIDSLSKSDGRIANQDPTVYQEF